MSYKDLMATVEVRGESDAKQILLVADVEQSRQDNIETITAITDTIAEGITLKTDIINTVDKAIAAPKARVRKVLEKHIGGDYSTGYRWEHAQRMASDPPVS